MAQEKAEAEATSLTVTAMCDKATKSNSEMILPQLPVPRDNGHPTVQQTTDELLLSPSSPLVHGDNDPIPFPSPSSTQLGLRLDGEECSIAARKPPPEELVLSQPVAVRDIAIGSTSNLNIDKDTESNSGSNTESEIARNISTLEMDPQEVEKRMMKEFPLGATYESNDDLVDSVRGFAAQNLFTVCKRGYNQVLCSLHYPKSKSGRTSNSCGCPVKLTYARKKGQTHVSILSLNALHNHPLTVAGQVTSQRRSGKVISDAITAATPVLAPYLMTKKKMKCCVIRSMLEDVVEDAAVLDAQVISNICRGVELRIKSGQYQVPRKISRTEIQKFKTCSTRDVAVKDCKGILEQLMAGEASNDSSWLVSQLMRELKKRDPEYFSYRFAYDSKGRITGCIWQDGRTRAALKNYGQRGFFDMRLSDGMNSLRWAYWSYTVITPNKQFVPGCEGVVIGETDAMHDFGMTGAVDMTPGFEFEDLRLAKSDEKLSEETMKRTFPNVVWSLDAFHFLVGNKGISILSKDFGSAWSLVKEHFHNATYAKTEEECLVSRVI